MRGLTNILLLFLAVTYSNSQNFPQGYYNIIEEKVLQEDRFYFFDTDLLQAIATAEPYSNIFISPLSIKTALTMILEGAANASEKEIKYALRLPDEKELIRKQFKELLQNFETKKKGVTLKLGNRIFVSHKLTPIQKYVDILEKYYFSNVTRVNFMNAKQSADIVNDWVDRETYGYISHIADQGTFSPDTSIFLANALYFKGVWLRSFSEQGTQAKCFELYNGGCQLTPMMDVVDNFKYGELKDADAKIVEIPYTGQEFSMVVMLPNKKDGIHQLVRDIRTSINNYVDNLTESEVHITLPRFSIDYSTDLVKYLPSVNIHTISQPTADLSGLTAQLEGKISKMLHKARIEVNEEGTVAAAVTGAVVIPLMGNMKPRFHANRPFLFFIRHIPTKTILFEGRVMVPEKAQQQQQPQQPQQQKPIQNQQRRPVAPQQQHSRPLQLSGQQQSLFGQQQSSFGQQPQSFGQQPSFVQNQSPTYQEQQQQILQQQIQQQQQQHLLQQQQQQRTQQQFNTKIPASQITQQPQQIHFSQPQQQNTQFEEQQYQNDYQINPINYQTNQRQLEKSQEKTKIQQGASEKITFEQ